MIHIEQLTQSMIPDVLNVRVAMDQVKFVGTVEEFLADGSDEGDSHVHLYVIKQHDDIVGYFKLDTAYALEHEFCTENSLGLRAFVIDSMRQGKGLGAAAVKALLFYLRQQRYLSYDFIYLTVNCKNFNAYACYIKGGFNDTGEQYLGGKAGPQYIMCASLNN